jgi:hypothetical protein
LQVIEPVYNEVSQTLSKALSGKFDLIERRNDPKSDLEYIDNDVDNDDDGYDDDDDDDDVKFYPTMPPIYPSVKSKPGASVIKLFSDRNLHIFGISLRVCHKKAFRACR